MAKSRTRLTNEEKEVGMTLQQKKDGVTVSQLKKKAQAANVIEGADIELGEATTIELTEEEPTTGIETISFVEEPPHGEEFISFEAENESTEEFVPAENDNVLTDTIEPVEKTQEDLNQSFEENRPTGLGDVIDAVTTATGIKSLVKFFTPEGEDCGCEERRKKFNELHLRGKQPSCLELEEYSFLKDFFDGNPTEANASQAMQIRTIYARIFRMDVSQVGSCSGCMRDIIKELRGIVGTYE